MDIDATLKKFEEEFKKLPTDVQYAIRDLIDEVGLNHTGGGCPWRVTQSQFELALPVLQIIAPSIAGEFQKNESIPTFRVVWNATDFIVPDMNNLEAFSPIAAACEPGQLCRSTSGDDLPSPQYDGGILCRAASGDDWCVTPKSVYADDDCPSSFGIPIPSWRVQPGPPIIITGRDIDQVLAAAAKSSGDYWCVTPKSVQAGVC